MTNYSILITGFEPFAGATRNPSESVVRALVNDFKSDLIITEILPVEYSAAEVRLQKLIDQYQPIAWIGFGLSNRATAVMLERIAFNLDDAAIPDNAGDLRIAQAIDPQGPKMFQSTLPLEKIAVALRANDIPVEFSDSAGRFVCNHVFYHALSIANRKPSLSLAGFVHIPWPCDWGYEAQITHTLTLETLTHAAHVCVSTILQALRKENILAT